MFTDLKNEWTDCQKCPLFELRNQIVFGHGNLDADLLIISEAPGKEEDAYGIPFSGPALSQIFNKLLAAIGISRSKIWITNTCMCRPKSTKPGRNNRAPTIKEVRACLPRLYDEINIIKPKLIVLAGNTPLNLATGKRGITKNRGWQNSKWEGNDFVVEQIYATLHPASILHGSTEQIKQKRQWIWDDWQHIARTLSVIEKKKRAEKGSQDSSQTNPT